MDEAGSTIEVSVSGADEQAAVAAGLNAVLTAARAGTPSAGADPGRGMAAAIRGQGKDLAGVAFELVNDLLAQLDAHGAGFETVRLDGLLTTDDGYTAWGYALGDAAPGQPPLDVGLDGPPDVERREGEVRLRIRLRRA